MQNDAHSISRLVDVTINSLPFTAAHSILSVPKKFDGIKHIAAMPGLGEDIRVRTAIDLWESDSRFSHLYITGTNTNEKLQPQLTIERLQQYPYKLNKTEGVLAQVVADHTRAQTDWLVDQLLMNGAESLILCVSHWHMTRAYMTLVKSMLNARMLIPVIPNVIGTAPNQIIPEVGQSVQKLSAGEAERIVKYSDTGQIVSSVELSEYLDWIWSSYLTD